MKENESGFGVDNLNNSSIGNASVDFNNSVNNAQGFSFEVVQSDNNIVQSVDSLNGLQGQNDNLNFNNTSVVTNSENVSVPDSVNNMDSASVYEEVEIKKSPLANRNDSYFDGKLLELIGWTLLKNLITIVTLGIANPWGECMLMRYQIEHTVLNGKRLKFVGTGGSLFVEKFKWFFFTLITLGLYMFVIPVRRYRWIFSNVCFEDETFIKNESFFDGKTIQLIGINILCNFLNVLSFGLLYAFTYCFKLKWVAKHAVICRKKIVFDGKSLNLFGKYLLWGFLTIITFGIFALWIGIKLSKWETKNTHIKAVNEMYKEDNTMLWLVIVLVLLLFGFLIFIATFDINVIKNSEFLGNIFSNITIGGSDTAVYISDDFNY